MKKIIASVFCLLMLVFAACAQTQKVTPTTLKVGDVAPDFKLSDNSGKEVKLSDFRGKKNVVLAFYVLAFTGG